MLTCLRVRHFAIIDELEVELEPGLNVVTGETGAGKSILVNALGLVLGARGRPEVVRTGEKAAEVEALFEIGDEPELLARLAAAGIAHEGELVVRRVIQANGRTRAYVNGQLATASQLTDLAAGLADISSQHEHHSLVEPSHHLAYLDAFGQLGQKRDDVARAHATLAAATSSLESLIEKERTRDEREDLLRYQIGEIDALAPEIGEDERLAQERNRLRHAEKLARTAGGAEEDLYASDEALCTILGRIGAQLEEAQALDPSLAPLSSQLADARAQLEDVAQELGTYARALSLEPGRLAELEDRLDAIAKLKRKYGGSLESVLTHREAAAAELSELDRASELMEELETARAEALARAREVASDLSRCRHAAAARLGAAIAVELSSLGMGNAEVRVEVAPLVGKGSELDIDGARLTPTGIDRAEFLISPNPGEEARPLRQVASGGELSRAMLAIKRVLAGLKPTGLYVFDEVDAGVGGAVAEVIGHKLRDVARHHQVLCITHLPQIAVFADAHYYVEKDVVGDRTKSAIRRLTGDERLEEVARMLGGLKITKKTRAAAAEMLREARP